MDHEMSDYFEPENPGHDATPEACALCDEPWSPFAEIVETTWGLMHEACAASHDDLAGEGE